MNTRMMFAEAGVDREVRNNLGFCQKIHANTLVFCRGNRI